MKKKNLILYHANCYDGFGGAYAAWKKFGKDATYLSAEQHSPLPGNIDGTDVYLIDFCFSRERLTELQRRAASVVVLDHHQGNRELISGNPLWRYSKERSGCGLAWECFHPDTPMPLLLQYVEEGDLWRYTLPHSEVLKYWIHVQKFDFHLWDRIVEEFKDGGRLENIVRTAEAYGEHHNWIVDSFARQARMVRFEGYEIPAVQAPRFIRSQLGHRLALNHPFSIVWSPADGGIRISLRSDGTVNLVPLAVKYGGNGHPNAAGIFIPCKFPLPFVLIDKNI